MIEKFCFTTIALSCFLVLFCQSEGSAFPLHGHLGEFPWPALSANDYALLKASSQRVKRELYTNFKHIFVSKNGSVDFQRGRIGTQIEIAGSPATSMAAVLVSAGYVSKIVKFMPAGVFRKVSARSSIGIFSASEKLTVFPEYHYLKNDHCGSSCLGGCSITCAQDGRKIENLAGIGGQRALVLDDNVLCSSKDPYAHKQNVLAHEFAHTIHQYALSKDLKTSIWNAYLNAKANKTWDLDSYAMSNYLEYFAVGAAVFLGVDVYSQINSGGMNECGGKFCESESSAREHLRVTDFSLYTLLSYIFTSNHPEHFSGLGICPDSSVLPYLMTLSSADHVHTSKK